MKTPATANEALEIKKIVNGGYGLAHLTSGQVVLVRHVLPGETVIVTIEEKKKNSLFGRLQQIVSPDPWRRTPPCPYAGTCGGCDLQHAAYPRQLQIKKQIVADLLLRSKGGELRETLSHLANPLAAPQEFGYRQRIRLQVDKGILGFHRFQSHSLLPIQACLLAPAIVNQALAALKATEDGRKLTALATEVELQENPLSGKTVIILRTTRQPRPADIQAAVRFVHDRQEVERIFFAGERFSIMGPYGNGQEGAAGNVLGVDYPALSGLDKPLQLRWEAGGFCQVNLRQNRTLVATVVDFCRAEKGLTILDLYCGMGNFSLPLALQGAEVLGIEGQGSAVRSAKNNGMLAGVDNVHFQQSSIDTACSELVAKGSRFDCLVIDPPRDGAPGLASRLAKLTGKRLVYISCDPATLCRDLAELLQHGFAIRTIQPIDMFPQTHHIENVVVLDKH